MPSINSAPVDAPIWKFNGSYHDLTGPAGSGVPDYLQKAIETQSILARKALSGQAGESHANKAGESHSDKAVSQAGESISQAAAARDKLAQEALLVDPTILHKAFDHLIADLKKEGVIDQNRHWLNLQDIDKGLKFDRISAEDKNTLTVLKAGYTALDHGPNDLLPSDNHIGEGLGITDNSLTMLETSFHPANKDIYFSRIGLIKPAVETIGFALICGAYGYVKTRDAKASLLSAGVGALSGLVYAAADVAKYEWYGGKEEMYGDLKKNYLDFESAFAKPEQPGPNEILGKHK